MAAFHSRWLDWNSPQTPTCATDKTDKSPSVSSGSATGRRLEGSKPAQTGHLRHVTLLPTPQLGQPNIGDPEEGRRIVDDLRATGANVDLSTHGIALMWPPGLDEMAPVFIDRIMAARTAVVLALK